MNRDIVTKWFDKYPKLEVFICAGTVSLKMAREILEIDRYFMYDIFKELIEAEAVTASGTNAWRATQELRDFVQERREKKESKDE